MLIVETSLQNHEILKSDYAVQKLDMEKCMTVLLSYSHV